MTALCVSAITDIHTKYPGNTKGASSSVRNIVRGGEKQITLNSLTFIHSQINLRFI